MNYRGKSVLVTGGLGFIGGNLAIRLVDLGAKVTVVDSSVEGCGADLRNILQIRSRIQILPFDIGQAQEFATSIAKADAIFNLAGEISHLRSMECPERDLQLNTVAQLRFLEVCKKAAPGIRIVYAGTRQVYGVPEYLPVDENHPISPVDFNGIHKYAAMTYHLMLSHSGCLDAVVLQLTNVYGPRMALDAPSQGFLSAFLRRLVRRERLEVYGDGAQLRDPVYVDDVVDAFLITGAESRLRSRVYNVGGPEPLSLASIAHICSSAAGVAAPEFRPFPDNLRKIDIGSYHTDRTRIDRELNWNPAVRFPEGIVRTLDYYLERRERAAPVA